MANTRIEQLIQIFHGAVWDGNLISKHDRDALYDAGLIERVRGWNILSPKGLIYIVELGLDHSGLTPPQPDSGHVPTINGVPITSDSNMRQAPARPAAG